MATDPRFQSVAARLRPSNIRRAHLRVEALEARAVPAFGFGSAFNIGGAGTDYGTGVATDSTGNLYVSGYYSGTVDFDPNQTNPNSNHVLTSGPINDGFTARYAPDGTFQWATDVGQSNLPRELAVQGSNVYVPLGNGNISRLDAATGTVTWTTSILGANGGTNYAAVAVGPSGDIYAAAQITSGTVVAQLDPSGNILWTRTSGGTVRGLAVDGSGNAYVGGMYTGTVTFGTTALTSWAGVQSAFVWKLNSTGGSVWARSMGSDGGAYAFGVTADAGGNVDLTGAWSGSNNNFNPGSGSAVKLTGHGGTDVYVVKLSPVANGAMKMTWAKDIGGTGGDEGTGIATDGAGNIYTTGYFTGLVNFNPNSGTKHTLSGFNSSLNSIFVSELDSSGNYVAAAQMGGVNSVSQGTAIALDGSGDVYTTGKFSATANFSPSGTYNLTPNGGFDAFVSKLTNTPGAMAPGGQNPGAPPSPAGTGTVTLVLTAPTITTPASADPEAPDQVDWLLAGAARKRSSLYTDWLAD